MRALKIELIKIIKSPLSWIGFALLLAFPLFIIIFIRTRFADKTALDITVFSIVTLIDTFALYIVCAMVSSLSFAGEFQHKTLRYILLRPISLGKLFFNKVLSSLLFVFTIFLTAVLLCLLLNSLLWDLLPLHGKGNVVLSNPLFRISLIIGSALVICLFLISVTTLFSVILKNQVTVIIVTVLLFLLLFILGFVFPQVKAVLPIYFRTAFFNEIGEEQINLPAIFIKQLILIGQSGLLLFLSFLIIKKSNITV